jgi:hypothetical protein
MVLGKWINRRSHPYFNQHVGWFCFWALAIVLAFGTVAWNLSRTDANRGVLLASFLATLGWLITIHATRANERRKATIDLVLRHHMDRSIEDHKYRILRAFPPYSAMDGAGAADVMRKYRSWSGDAAAGGAEAKPPVGFSIIQVLNFYEFIAVGVRKGRLDEGIAFDSFAALSRNMLVKFAPFIALCRPRDAGSPPSRIYRDLAWLAKRWHRLDLDAEPVLSRPSDGHWRQSDTDPAARPAPDVPPLDQAAAPGAARTPGNGAEENKTLGGAP